MEMTNAQNVYTIIGSIIGVAALVLVALKLYINYAVKKLERRDHD